MCTQVTADTVRPVLVVYNYTNTGKTLTVKGHWWGDLVGLLTKEAILKIEEKIVLDTGTIPSENGIMTIHNIIILEG